MKEKNDCERDYIKEAFIKLYNCVMPYIDLTQLDDASIAFNELENKVHSEIYILKKCLAERDRAVDAGLTRSEVDRERISDLEEKLNRERKHGEDLADANSQLASENADLKAKTGRLTLLETSRTGWRSRAQHAEKRVMDLNKNISDLEKRIHELEEENANLRVTPPDANAIEVLRGENEMLWSRIKEVEEEKSALRTRNETLENVISALKRRHEMLWSRIEVLEIAKRPWHGDGNAMTGAQTCCESLTEAIEFQNKKIEELEAEKARLKEAYDIQETTIKRLKLLLGKECEEKEVPTVDHEFEFGDKVFVPWSDGPYMYIKPGELYNPRTKGMVYVGKTQHLKWTGEKFEIK